MFWLFVSRFSSLSRIFHSYGDVTMTGCKCWALMAVVHWRFFGLPHLLWHRASLYAGHLRGPVAPYLLPTVWQWSCQYLFYNLGLSRLGFEHPTFRLRGECSNLLPKRRVHFCLSWDFWTKIVEINLSCKCMNYNRRHS